MRTSTMRKTLIIILLAHLSVILVPAWSYAKWIIYRKPAFQGKVIDAASKSPLSGAVVVVMYYSSPIITGPGGGSPYIIHVKEALTDEDGMFRIPSYTTLIQPNSVEHKADFIIYKPGYGKLPSSKVTPDIHFLDPEIYFSRTLGETGEMHWRSGSQSKDIPVTYGIVELPKLETKEERLKAIPGRPSGFYEENLPLLYEAINEEHNRLGVKRLGR
jgi:hypothetical protein